MRITKIVEFDAGHRVPYHKSKCRSLHGHRYRLECAFSGPIIQAEGASDDGMVADFSDLKGIMMEEAHDVFDHALILSRKDPHVDAIAQASPDTKIVLLPCSPTVENLASVIFERVSEACDKAFEGRVSLSHLRLFETPNSWADLEA